MKINHLVSTVDPVLTTMGPDHGVGYVRRVVSLVGGDSTEPWLSGVISTRYNVSLFDWGSLQSGPCTLVRIPESVY